MDVPNLATQGRRALLVFWEGADWSLLLPLLQDGLLPNLQGLIARGSKGNIVSHYPFCPTPLFVSALSGVRPWRHGVLSESGQTVPRMPLLWDTLPEGGAVAVNVPDCCAFASAQGGCLTRSHLDSAEALGRTSFGEELAELFVPAANLESGLLRLLCPALSAAVAANDPLVQVLADHLARHYTAHNVAASLLETEPWTLGVLRFDFLEKILKSFSAYSGVGVPGIPTTCQERYGGVVKGACRLMDFLLGDILRSVGECACFVLSTRGLPVLSDAVARAYPLVSPGAGFLVAGGAGLARGGSAGTVSLLDLVPTLRGFWNMPQAAGLPGRVWDEILQTQPEAVRGDDTCGAEPILPSPSLLLPGEAFALGVDLYEDGKLRSALPYLERAALLEPERPEYAFWLSCVQAASGDLEASCQSEAVMLAYLPPDSRSTSCWQALLASQRGQLLQVVALLEKFASKEPLPPSMSSCYARALMESNQWHRALEFLTRELERGQSHDLWLGAARCYLEFRRFEDAEAAARRVLDANPGLAEAHAILALALHGQSRGQEAGSALQAAEARAKDWPMVQRAHAQLAEKRSCRSEADKVTGAAAPFITQTLKSDARGLEFRAPDAMEQERVRKSLLLALPDDAQWQKRVWVRCAPYSHIVGAAAWFLPKGEAEAKVALRLCARWRVDADLAERVRPLFDDLFRAGARVANVTSLEPVEWERLLPSQLRYVSWTSEDWLGDPVLAAEALKPYAGLEKAALGRNWRLRQLCEADWDLAQKWGPDAAYLEPDDFNRVRASADAKLSIALENPEGAVSGLLLVTRAARLARVEFIVGNPAQSDYWPLCTVCLFGHLLRQATDCETYDAFTLSTNLNHGRAMHRLAHRLRMFRTREQSHARLQVICQSAATVGGFDWF